MRTKEQLLPAARRRAFVTLTNGRSGRLIYVGVEKAKVRLASGVNGFHVTVPLDDIATVVPEDAA